MNMPALPINFTDRLKEIIPATDYQGCIETFSQKPSTTFWINTLKTTAEALLSKLKQQDFNILQITQLQNTYSIPDEQRRAFTETDAFKNGEVYIQNIASMLPVILLDPQPDEKILDLTAAPGSKTIQMAMMLKNKGSITAVEVVKSRFFRLQANLKKHGIENIKTYLKDGTTVWKHCEQQFDKILLDAPCSSEARFNIHEPTTFAYWSEKKIKEMSRKQKQLIYSAIHSLKPGGTLLYSTCSFAPEENECIINHAFKKCPNIQIDPITFDFDTQNFIKTQPGLTQWKNKSLHPNLENTLRILPSSLMHAFYLCKLKIASI